MCGCEIVDEVADRPVRAAISMETSMESMRGNEFHWKEVEVAVGIY